MEPGTDESTCRNMSAANESSGSSSDHGVSMRMHGAMADTFRVPSARCYAAFSEG